MTKSTILTLNFTAIGNSIGFALPKEVAARLKVEKDDTMHLIEMPSGDTRFSEAEIRIVRACLTCEAENVVYFPIVSTTSS